MLEALLAVLGELYFFLGYISGKESFPPPLNDKEEAVALSRLQQGDPKAREDLIVHNLRLVAHVSKKFTTSGIEQEDLISIGIIGLIKAVETFKLDSGTQLATYAARCIENEILMSIRARKKHRGEVSLYDPVGVDKEGNEISLLDVLGTEADMVEGEVEQRVSVGLIRAAIKQELSEKERVVLEQRYGLSGEHPKPQREVAQMLQISRSYVSRLETKAIEKVARALKQREDA